MERNIRTHITVDYTDTHENWAESFYHSGNTGESHNPYIWHLFSALSVSLCNIFSFLGNNRDNRMRCEHTWRHSYTYNYTLFRGETLSLFESTGHNSRINILRTYILKIINILRMYILRLYLWWSLCTLYLHACKVRVTVGDSGLCCCTCVSTYFER